MKEKRQTGEKGKKAKKKRKAPSISTIILIAIMLVGAGIFLYPSVSDWWNSMHATRAIAGYVDSVNDMSGEDLQCKASQWN